MVMINRMQHKKEPSISTTTTTSFSLSRVLTSGRRLGLNPIGQINCVISVEPLRALHDVSKIELVWKALIKVGCFLLL